MNLPHVGHPSDLATEFLSTRRRRWSAQLERVGVQRWRAQQLAASLFTSADLRALLHELGGAVAVAGSLAASAVALLLL